MKLNLFMVVTGLSLLCLGIYRIVPLRFNRAFMLANGPIIFLFLVALVTVLCLGKLGDGLRSTIGVTASFLPLMITLFPLMGLSAVIASRYEDGLTSMLAGNFGYPGTLLAASVTPGGNSVAKFVETLWQNPSLRWKLLFFLSVVPLVSFHIFLIRQMGFSTEIAWAMYRCNIIIAVVLVPVFWLMEKWAPKVVTVALTG